MGLEWLAKALGYIYYASDSQGEEQSKRESGEGGAMWILFSCSDEIASVRRNLIGHQLQFPTFYR